MPRLLRLQFRNRPPSPLSVTGPTLRSSPPERRSTRITSAPKSASSIAQRGPFITPGILQFGCAYFNYLRAQESLPALFITHKPSGVLRLQRSLPGYRSPNRLLELLIEFGNERSDITSQS